MLIVVSFSKKRAQKSTKKGNFSKNYLLFTLLGKSHVPKSDEFSSDKVNNTIQLVLQVISPSTAWTGPSPPLLPPPSPPSPNSLPGDRGLIAAHTPHTGDTQLSTIDIVINTIVLLNKSIKTFQSIFLWMIPQRRICSVLTSQNSQLAPTNLKRVQNRAFSCAVIQ